MYTLILTVTSRHHDNACHMTSIPGFASYEAASVAGDQWETLAGNRNAGFRYSYSVADLNHGVDKE